MTYQKEMLKILFRLAAKDSKVKDVLSALYPQVVTGSRQSFVLTKVERAQKFLELYRRAHEIRSGEVERVRDYIIRTAYANPALRPLLLDLLKRQGV